MLSAETSHDHPGKRPGRTDRDYGLVSWRLIELYFAKTTLVKLVGSGMFKHSFLPNYLWNVCDLPSVQKNKVYTSVYISIYMSTYWERWSHWCWLLEIFDLLQGRPLRHAAAGCQRRSAWPLRHCRSQTMERKNGWPMIGFRGMRKEIAGIWYINTYIYI